MDIRKPKTKTGRCCCILAILPVLLVVFLLSFACLVFYIKGMVREQYENRPESRYITGGKNESYMRKQEYSCLEMDIDYDNFRKYEQTSGLEFKLIGQLGYGMQRYQFPSTPPPNEGWITIYNGFYCVVETEYDITTTVYDLGNKRLYQNRVTLERERPPEY